jgi:hypothetical protein
VTTNAHCVDFVSGVEFAAYFVAVQADGAERILRRHYPMPNGLCAGCLATPTVHPCQAARIAELAQQRSEYFRRMALACIDQ